MYEKEQFVHKQVLDIFPWIKARTLISWSERGLIRPELGEADGRGTRRRYSYQNLIEIGVVNELLRYGIPFATVETIIQRARLSQRIQDEGFDMLLRASVRAPTVVDNQNKSSPPLSRETRAQIMADLRFREDFEKSKGKEVLKLDEVHLVAETMFGGEEIRDVVTSCIIINIPEIKTLVDARIAQLQELVNSQSDR